MRICVYGPGAIGGHLAARLAKGGAEVSVVARGATLAAIRDKGLTVRVADGDIHCRPRAAERAEELGPQDAVVVTTKVPALPAVAAGIAPLLGPDTHVSFVVNGIPWWYFDRHGGPQEGQRVPEADPGDAIRRAGRRRAGHRRRDLLRQQRRRARRGRGDLEDLEAAARRAGWHAAATAPWRWPPPSRPAACPAASPPTSAPRSGASC